MLTGTMITDHRERANLDYAAIAVALNCFRKPPGHSPLGRSAGEESGFRARERAESANAAERPYDAVVTGSH